MTDKALLLGGGIVCTALGVLILIAALRTPRGRR